MTSPADDLRALLAEAQPTDYCGNLVDRDGAEEWLSRNGAAVLALLDAAQALRETQGTHPQTGDPRGFSFDSNAAAVALAAAVAALTEPRP